MTEIIENNYRFENDRISDGLDIYFWVFNDASSFVGSHWHTAIELMYIIEGEVDVVINNKTTELFPGDIYLIDSTVVHSTKSIHGNRAILVQLPYALLEKYIPNINSLNFSFDHKTEDPILRTKIIKLIELLKQMQVVFEIKPDGGVLRFNSLVFELMFQLYHNFSRVVPESSLKKEAKVFDRIKTILDYSNEHYNEPITLSEIASVAYLQEDYFCHFFKKEMGVTYFQYLNEIRLSHIYHDLVSTNLSLKAILEKHGFTNYKLFRRMFYEQFKTTPGEYRKLNQNNSRS